MARVTRPFFHTIGRGSRHSHRSPGVEAPRAEGRERQVPHQRGQQFCRRQGTLRPGTKLVRGERGEMRRERFGGKQKSLVGYNVAAAGYLERPDTG